MGILTLLRNAFGRSRKSRATDPEGANETPAQSPAPVPEPRRSPAEPETEHELVAAAFDKVKAPGDATTPVITLAPRTDPAPDAEAPKPEAEPEPEPPAAAAEPEPETAKATPEPETAPAEAEPEPETARTTEAEAETTSETAQPDAEPETAEAKSDTAAEAEPKTAEPKAEADTEPEATDPVPDAKPETAEPAEAVAGAVADGDAAADPQAADGGDTPQGPPAPDDETRTGGAGGNTDAEGEAEADTAAEAEPKTAEPKAEADTEPEATDPVPDAKPETAEPADAVAGAVADGDAAADPQAADGEDTPQGPPAPDDETRTGGAGGNTRAEGEAEADARTDTRAEDDAEAPEPAGEAKPATTLAKVKSRTPALTAAYKAATATLAKTGLTGTRAKLYLVLDRSASMRPYYKDGSAQALADQTLALAAHLDPEATVHVVFFSTEVDGTTDLTLAPGHETGIDDAHAGLGRMGRTSYHAAVAAVREHYDRHHTPGTPALVVFQTDGAPDAKTPATQALTEAAGSHPALFFSFVAFGEHDNKAFDYLRKLKSGNTSFFHAGPAPRELTDTELYEGVLAAWRP
ncbi:VWA domain-containing protein [Streptomyces sp. NPDC017095]|uniref:VWA domain-containing protein n=1 Tax=Streptomyces sp. NPDC017095 TaxID=3364977 RepID=UPI0037917091